MITLPAQINGYLVLLAILVFLIVYIFFESLFHNKRLKRIPYRIHVNGTRGKSSVARLIGAGLRAGGIATSTKTTGTLPRFIDPGGKETPIYRPGHTNIIEQLKVVKWALMHKSKALVIECMAVQPLLQSLCELKIVQSTHGVLTNARADHLDVMGPTEADVALALAATVPVKGMYFTPEEKYLETFKMAIADRDSKLEHISKADIEAITKQDLEGFSYQEYASNVALALKVCQSLGVEKSVALKGMHQAIPDPGALSVYTYMDPKSGKTIYFANGFAANDPISTRALWERVREQYKDATTCVLLVNTRVDRKERTMQLVDDFSNWSLPDNILLMGTGREVFAKKLPVVYPDPQALPPIVEGDFYEMEALLEAMVKETKGDKVLVVGALNIAQMGLQCVEFFREHKNDC